MFAKLLVLFTIIPVLELCVLIPMGQKVGLGPTLGLIIFTAFAGALLGKYQGASAWKRIKGDLATGKLPSDSILDGLAVLLASAFLVTPGILTDLTGFILLIPFTRKPIRAFAKARLEKWLNQEQVGLFGSPFGGAFDFDHEDDELYAGFSGPQHHDQVVIDIQGHERKPTSEQEASIRPEVITIGQER